MDVCGRLAERACLGLEVGIGLGGAERDAPGGGTPGRNSCAKATCPMARPSSRPESLHSASTLPMVCFTSRDPAPAMADWSTTSGFSPWCSARNTLTIIGFTAWPSAETMS